MLLILADSGLSLMLTKVTSNPYGPRATLGGPSTAHHYQGCRSPISVMKLARYLAQDTVFKTYLLFFTRSARYLSFRNRVVDINHFSSQEV